MGVAGLSEDEFFLEQSLFFLWPTGRAFTFDFWRWDRLDAAWRLALEVLASFLGGRHAYSVWRDGPKAKVFRAKVASASPK